MKQLDSIEILDTERDMHSSPVSPNAAAVADALTFAREWAEQMRMRHAKARKRSGGGLALVKPSDGRRRAHSASQGILRAEDQDE